VSTGDDGGVSTGDDGGVSTGDDGGVSTGDDDVQYQPQALSATSLLVPSPALTQL
jgi:hypothetical protein